MSKKIVAIVGTTASGKSALGIELAKKMNGEVISADSRQVYKGLDVASGKVTHEEMNGVPHHLLDVVWPQERFSAADFVRDGRAALYDIWERERIPFVVGGTGFYVDALLGRVELGAVPPNEELRAYYADTPAEELFAELERIDPARARDIASKGEQTLTRRLVRALEIARGNSENTTDTPPLPADVQILWIGLDWETDVLRERIHTRLVARLDEGMIEEIERLHQDGVSWERLDELGLECRYIAQHLQGILSREEMEEQLETKIWQYAKRQRTWFKRNEEIQWFTPSEQEKIREIAEEFLNA